MEGSLMMELVAAVDPYGAIGTYLLLKWLIYR